MFAVYRTRAPAFSDDCIYSADTVLFVTACEQTAKDAVTLAELELEQALAVPQPSWTAKDIDEKGVEYVTRLREDYSKELKGIFTVDVLQDYFWHINGDNTYYYEEVEVR